MYIIYSVIPYIYDKTVEMENRIKVARNQG